MKTLALVIGNNEYHKNAKLDNAVNDATGIKEVFDRLGFEVIFKTNFLEKEIPNILTEFKTKIADYDASIFYFAGHGFELEGENYLAPVDIQIPPTEKPFADRNCIRLSEIIEIHKNNKDKIHIVILDACRQSFGGRGGIIGFSPIQIAKGTLIAFSTSPNEGASDTGISGHSVYTGALLQYIGRKRLSVEALFKNVRKTVYTFTNGKQITWEHTSLIEDYYFNEGQMVYNVDIPYDEKVVKDIYYDDNNSEFGKLIVAVKSHNWYVQNPAISQLLTIKNLDKNQQFILGRNLLQAADGGARSAEGFMSVIKNSILLYNVDEENHLLNGILFEIYFNSRGDFRRDKTKMTQQFEEIISLRKISELKKSFNFINGLLTCEYKQYPLIYLPKPDDEILDINVIATEGERNDVFGKKQVCQIINSITYNNIDITEQIAESYRFWEVSKEKLEKDIACFFTAPISLIEIHSNINLSLIYFDKNTLGNT